MTEIKAQLNNLHMAPRKVRLVAHLIKGLDVARADLELRMLPKRATLPILKLVRSAVANATHNFQLSEKGLYIKEITVSGGQVLKRFRPRAFGRASAIRKRTSHIALVLASRDADAKPVRALRRAKPTVRTATPEDLKELRAEKRVRKDSGGNTSAAKPKQSGFMKKIFNRKAV